MLVSAAVNLLDCFTAEPGAKPGLNVCPGTYSKHPNTMLTACASLCLDDPACNAFAMGGAGNSSSGDCRLSSACTQPTAHLSAYDGYTKKPGSTPASCHAGPPAGISFHSQDGLFADGMLLQRGSNTHVWGEGAQPSATVMVTVGGLISVAATAEATGAWSTTLPPVRELPSLLLLRPSPPFSVLLCPSPPFSVLPSSRIVRIA